MLAFLMGVSFGELFLFGTICAIVGFVIGCVITTKVMHYKQHRREASKVR